MPEQEAKERGLTGKVRTILLPGKKYIHVDIVKKAGPRGGHTVAGPVHLKKPKTIKGRP